MFDTLCEADDEHLLRLLSLLVVRGKCTHRLLLVVIPIYIFVEIFIRRNRISSFMVKKENNRIRAEIL